MIEGKPPSGERLQKFLAAAGVASRRHAEAMIRQGRVTVNGEPSHLGQRVDPADVVRVDGVEVGPQAPRTVVLNKPVGVVTTMDDPQGRPTVAGLVDLPVRVYPVGRLDCETAGLLLMTNDGELAHRLMHPSFGVEKRYRVLVEGRVGKRAVQHLAGGVELDDGPTQPARVRVVESAGSGTLLEMVLKEGRNRQVRRMCDAVGHPVAGLTRIGYGPLTLRGLAPGSWRELDPRDVRRLRKLVGLGRPRTRERESAEGSVSGEEQ